MEIKAIGINDDIICPYCNRVLASAEDEDFEICEHTIFVDTSAGFEWIREDLEDIVTELFSDSYDEESLSKFPLKGILLATQANMGVNVYWGFAEG